MIGKGLKGLVAKGQQQRSISIGPIQPSLPVTPATSSPDVRRLRTLLVCHPHSPWYPGPLHVHSPSPALLSARNSPLTARRLSTNPYRVFADACRWCPDLRHSLHTLALVLGRAGIGR